MAKRKTPKRPTAVVGNAVFVMGVATGEISAQPKPVKNEAAVALGRLGGLKGGAARYTRLTNAHSKKFENHCHMVALYTVWYNFVRVNSAVRMAPAMAAGVSDRLWTMADLVAMIDVAALAPAKRGPYKKKLAD